MPYYTGVSSFPFFALLFLLLMHHLGSIAVLPASEIFNSSSLHDVLQEPQAAGPVTDTGPQALLRITVEMHTSRAVLAGPSLYRFRYSVADVSSWTALLVCSGDDATSASSSQAFGARVSCLLCKQLNGFRLESFVRARRT